MMRVLFFWICCASAALNAQTHELLVSFEGASKYPTRIAYEILDKEGVSIQVGFFEIENEIAIYTIDAGVAEKAFAVQVYEDANNNSKLDRGFFGQPVEKYAFSNDAWAVLSKPDIKEMIVQPMGKGTRMHFVLKSVTDF